MKYVFAFIIIILLSPVCCFAQTAQLKLDKLTTDNGLPDNRVQAILQDDYGYIWMPTVKGVVRYDGYKTYVYRLASGKNMHNSVDVFTLIKDADGTLWAGTSEGGIYRYERNSDKFIQYTHNPADTHSLPYTNVLSLHLGTGNDLWAITFLRAEANHTQALSLFDRKTGGFINYGIEQKGKYHLNSKLISGFLKDNSGQILILLDSGLYRYNKPDGVFKKITFSTALNFSTYNRLYQIPGDNDHVWLASFASGIARLNLADKTIKVFRQSSTPGSLPSDTVSSLVIDRQRRLWVGSPLGLLLFNPQADTFKKYFPVIDDPFKRKSDFFRYRIDGVQTIWFSSNNYIVSFNTNSLKYKYYPIDRNDNSGLNNFMSNVMIDRAHDLWLSIALSGAGRVNALRSAFNLNQINNLEGTPLGIYGFLEKSRNEAYVIAGDGLYTWNFANNTCSKINVVNGLQFNMFSLASNTSGMVAVGINEGFGIYDPLKNLFRVYKNDLKDPNAFKGEDSRAVLADRQGNFWIGTGDMGVTIFNPKTGKFRPLPYNTGAPASNFDQRKLDDKAAECLYEDSNGTIWVGTYNGGINRFNPKDSSFTSYYHSNPDVTDIGGIYEDKKHRFWVATQLNGLFLFDRKTGKAVKQFTEADGLLSDEVNSIIEDPKGRLWLSSSLGLSVLDPESGKIIKYNKTDALPDDDPGSPIIMSNGRVLYTSRKGFISFYFNDVKSNPYPPQVLIETVLHSNPTADIPKTDTIFALNTKKAELPYNQNQVTFNFVALHYTNPAQNECFYRLQGFDKSWVSTTTQHSVTYNNLSSGTYTFRIKARSSDGVWTTKDETFVLTITAPLWLRWWAWVLYVVLFILAVQSFLKYRSRRLLKENQLLEERIRLRTNELSLANTELNEQRGEIIAQRDQVTETLKELEQTQGQLIQAEKMASLGELTAGIAHEIQNPLNFVNNFAEVSRELITEMKEELLAGNMDDVADIAVNLDQNLEKINHHGKRAESIVKGMLEHSRASSGVKEPTDLNKLADEYLRLAYHGLRAKDKMFNATLITNFDEQLPLVNAAQQDLGRVLLNLFNNAFYAAHQKQKTAQADYKPTVTVTTFVPPSGGCTITVRDNGTGIPEAIKDKIMQPFFTTKPTGQGTGLGLSLSYDIVVKGHGGTITVNSADGEGSEFTINLPA